jgi:hypothetical protein
MILRGLLGIIIGVSYGGLVGVLMFLLTRIGLDRVHPGPLIPNAIQMAWWVTVMSGVITGVSGALVGLVVVLSGVDKAKAAGIGLGIGLLVFALLSIDSWAARGLFDISWENLLTFLTLPIGLAVMSVLVSIVAARLKPYDL